MGAPRNLDEVSLFLKNMFNDKNIITVKSDLLRKFIATAITVARSRSAKENYAHLGGISPLVKETDSLVEKLSKRYPKDLVLPIMRYTPPFARDEIKFLKAKGVDEVVLLPLYPHYSTTTTKSSLEDFYESAKELGFEAKVREVKPFYRDRGYNEALIERIEEALCPQRDDPKEIDLIFSAHSLPMKIVEAGDPYQKQVEEHTSILQGLLEERGLFFGAYHLAYQSKLGPVEWLEPSLSDKLAKIKSKKALIVPLSFCLDNSETELELDIEYRIEAKGLGYEYYKVAKAPNSSHKMVEALSGLIG